MANNVLGEPEFVSPRAIREYCQQGRNHIRPLFHELHVSAEELEMVLRELPSANPGVFGMADRGRAKLVSGHMRRAAEAAEVCSASLVRTFMSFRKHYLLPVEQGGKPRQQFDFTDQ
jgi:hypothetical protein